MNTQEQNNQTPSSKPSLSDGASDVDVKEINGNETMKKELSAKEVVKEPQLARFEIINVNEILNFVNGSLNAQKAGVLDANKAFNIVVDMLQKSIKPM